MARLIATRSGKRNNRSQSIETLPAEQPWCTAARSTWGMASEDCGQKLPFEFWIYMKAEGTAEDPDAKHVWNACLKPRTIDFVELITPEVSGYKHTTTDDVKHPVKKMCLRW